jgi:hypothetical protein
MNSKAGYEKVGKLLDFKLEISDWRYCVTKNSLQSPVTVSYLSPEELEAYRKRTRPKYYSHKNRRVIDWRWPQNRKRKE